MAERDATAEDKTFVFTDIEGSTRLWEEQPEAMRIALAHHDALTRQAIADHRGHIVKSTGDGVHAAFDDAADALAAVLALQRAIAAAAAEDRLALRLRCGVHRGPAESRDGDYYGPALNRAARLMAAAHGGQTLVSQAAGTAIGDRLPPGAQLRPLGTVRLRDLADPMAVLQLVHPGLRAAFPPLRSLEATPNNLAQQLNSFVGREREQAEVREALASCRLLTLVGMGGIGKSRLSVQLGAELIDEFPDGVWLVELAPLADERLVPQALASVLGVTEAGGRTPLDALLAHLRDKSALILLDNCEHLRDACAALAKQVLQAAAGVKVLASSRDPLQVAGEEVYAVPTLSVPERDADARTLDRHEAVRLFVDRARAAQPRFRLDADTAGAVADICRRLDGIPLAIELAAARTRSLGVRTLAERLTDRFRLLVSSDQTVLPRQRTLRALIDWSFELLSEAERALFRRLAVFAGGWTLAAAEAVTADDTLPEAEVLDLLGQLVTKSLVVMEPGGERYRMLETVRAYAFEKLEAAHEATATQRRHVAHHLALAEAARLKLFGAEQGEALARLDRERENLLAAHAFCMRDADSLAQGLQLVFVLKGYWRARGLLSLGLGLTLEALARTSPTRRDFARCRVLCDAGQLCWGMGRYDEARRLLEESQAIAAEIGDSSRIAAVLQPLGQVYLALGERAEAQAIYRTAVSLAVEQGDQRMQAAALNSLAQLHRADGELERAETLYDRVITLARQLGDQDSIAIGLLNRSTVGIMRGQPGSALPLLREVHAIAKGIGSRPVEQSLLEVCAGLSAAVGRHWACARLYGAAEATARATGIRRDVSDEQFLQAQVERSRAALGAPGFESARRSGEAASAEQIAVQLAEALELPG